MLFETIQNRLTGRENPAMGAIKELVVEAPDLPEDRDDALAVREGVKAKVLGEE